LRDLQLRYATSPHDLRAGNAGVLVIEAVADGVTAAQMPELQLPPIDGVQVFADPVQADETFRDGRPRVKLTRRFSLVPSRAGAARLSGLRIDWWDVGAGAKRTAALPPLAWTVAAADGTPAPTTVANATAPTAATPAPTGIQGADRGWVLAALLFAALWLFTLVWGLHQRAQHAPHSRAGAPGDSPSSPLPPRTSTELKRALEIGSLGDVADVLQAMAAPPARDIDELLARLDDPQQRDALDALQRARWGNGDGVRARQVLKGAFANGPRWRGAPAPAPSLLPPLYPEG
jgi:hypothetical protein